MPSPHPAHLLPNRLGFDERCYIGTKLTYKNHFCNKVDLVSQNTFDLAERRSRHTSSSVDDRTDRFQFEKRNDPVSVYSKSNSALLHMLKVFGHFSLLSEPADLLITKPATEKVLL